MILREKHPAMSGKVQVALNALLPGLPNAPNFVGSLGRPHFSYAKM